MKKHFFLLFLTFLAPKMIFSQAKGAKIGYIDMEYILQNVPSYLEANEQLEQKSQKWKQEIEVKKNEINTIKEVLKAEKTLLTKSLIEEREMEIKLLEDEMFAIQQKHFGPKGNLTTQKTDLIKPIQDQIFTAIQDIADTQKYDFIFDKTSDLTMIFANKRYDISDLVLRILNRANKREQLSKKQLEAEIAREKKQDSADLNPAIAERQKALEERKTARDQAIEDRRIAAEAKKKEIEDNRAKILQEREAAKTGTIPANTKTETTSKTVKAETAQPDKATQVEEEQDRRAKIIEDRKKAFEERKQLLEARKEKILRERDSIRRSREEKLKQ